MLVKLYSEFMGRWVLKYSQILPMLGIALAMCAALPNNWGKVAAQENVPAAMTFCYQDKELFPNYMGETNSKLANKPGINIELVDLIALNLNLNVRYVRYSWNRCLALLKVGRVDSLIASYNKDRAEYAVYPVTGKGLDIEKRINTLGYYMYHTAMSPVWDGEGLLDTNTMVAAPRGYSVVKMLRDLGINVIETGSPEDTLKLLLHKRVDAIAVPGTTADALIRADITRYSDIKKDPAPITQRPYFIIFSQKFSELYPELTKAIWQQTSSVRATYRQQLIDKYYTP